MSLSPRFPERRQKLKQILSIPLLKKIWKDHVRQANRHQSISDLSDYYDIHLDLEAHLDIALDRINRGNYRPEPPIRVLMEKSKGLCRQIIIPAPIDALILQAMVNSILHQVISNQPNRNAYYQPQAHKIGKSRQQRIKDGEYDDQSSWLSFQKALFNFTKSHDFIVVTDIANFFDHISFTELRNIYGSFESVDEDILDFIFFILENYNWRPDYMPDKQIGLPQMNFDAPRLLAHSFLFELDRYLTQEAVGSYARFMDDMDIGVSSIGEGKKILRDIDLVLQTRGVRLNSGKSKILTAKQASEHYFVGDNKFLASTIAAIEKKKGYKKSIQKEVKRVRKRFDRSIQTPGYFDAGNGEKILKRYLTFFIEHKIEIPNQITRDIVFNRASLREYAMHYLTFMDFSKSRYNILRDYLLSEICTDEASLFAGARAIVDMKCPNSKAFASDVYGLALELVKKSKTGLASAFWLLSKFGTRQQIIDLVRISSPVWTADHWLGRQVGALYPYFSGDRILGGEFLEYIRSSHNRGSQSTFSLHQKIAKGEYDASLIFQYLKAENSSHPRKISHSKLLMMISFMRSPADINLKNKLSNAYKSFNLDQYEQRILKERF